MTTQLATQEDRGHFVIARSHQEMQAAQARMVEWFEGKVAEEKAALCEIQATREAALANRLNVKGLDSAERRARQRVVFYMKCREAVAAGYQLIPDLALDVFAIRTSRKVPVRHEAAAKHPAPSIPDESAMALVPGEGKYVSPAQRVRRGSYPDEEGGKQITKYFTTAVEHGEVEFPVIAAHPQLMSAASEAMALKLFDEIGVVVPQAQQRDPLLVGRIKQRGGASWRVPAAAFLIAWWVDLRTL